MHFFDWETLSLTTYIYDILQSNLFHLLLVLHTNCHLLLDSLQCEFSRNNPFSLFHLKSHTMRLLPFHHALDHYCLRLHIHISFSPTFSLRFSSGIPCKCEKIYLTLHYQTGYQVLLRFPYSFLCALLIILGNISFVDVFLIFNFHKFHISFQLPIST